MKNGTGLSKETSAALATLFGPSIIAPILFLIIEKDEYARFWAMQSVLLFASLLAAFWGIGILALILAPVVAFINGLLMLLSFILWLTFVYKSWQGERWVAPVIGPLAEKMLTKVK